MLKSAAFDLEGNIVCTKVPIYVMVKQPDGSRKEEAVPNAEFDKKLQDKENVRRQKPEIGFREFSGSGKLIQQVFDAIEDKGPSREKFTTSTVECSPTHIITSNGHPREEYKMMHKKIIFEILSQEQREKMTYNMGNHLGDNTRKTDEFIDIYLNNNLYIPCADPELVKMRGWQGKTGEEKKTLAFEKCTQQSIDTYTKYYGEQFMKNRHISIGFSDDLKRNIDRMQTYMANELIKKFPGTKFVLYDTSDPKNICKQIFGNI